MFDTDAVGTLEEPDARGREQRQTRRGRRSARGRQPTVPPLSARLILLSVGIIAAYAGLARLSLAFTVAGQPAPVAWLSAGVAIAAAVLGGRALLPAVFLGALAAESLGTVPVAAVVPIAAGNVAAAALAAAVMGRVGIHSPLERIRDVAWFLVLAAGLSTALSATAGSLTLLLTHSTSVHGVLRTWRAWWLGDLVGVATVASAIFVFAHQPLRRHELRDGAVAAGLALVLGLAVIVLGRRHSPLVVLTLPILLYLAVRFRQRGATFGVLALTTAVVALAASGRGILAGGHPAEQLLRAQLSLGIVALTALLTAAARAERDVAESALARLAESRQALADAQRLAQVGSLELQIDSRRLTVSDELVRMFDIGKPPAQITLADIRARVPPEGRRLIDETYAGLAPEQGSYAIVHRVIRRDGEHRTVESQGRVEFDAAGRPVRLIGTVKDITQFKAAEDRFRSLLETAPDAIVIVDEPGDVVLVNSRAELMFGVPREEIVGRPVQRLVPVNLTIALERFAADGELLPGQSLGSGLDLFATGRDGREFPVEIMLGPLRTDGGRLISLAIRDVTDRKATADALAHQATHDALTGLPNRTLFLDRLDHALARARRARSKLAVLFLDLDDFKLVNDTLGHDAGDQLLVALTPRLKAALRPGDTVARFGGDEFVVLCEELPADAVALDIAGRIADACARPVIVAGTEHVVTVSAGAAIVDDGASTPADLLRDADAAMYRAKAHGNGRVEIFDARMRARLLERIDVESELRRAIERRQLRLHFQPIVSLADNEVVGCEALLRWQHPERGLLEPSDFMPIAESTGLIVELGEWALARACREAVGWSELAGRPIAVSVNVAPRQVIRTELARTVAAVLEQTGLDPTLLQLEITESALFEEPEIARQAIDSLRALGVGIVLDDFGTGYSSLWNLRRFAFDAVKVDGSFVGGLEHDAEDAAIVQAVLSMAAALDVEVVAEGVETIGQSERLRESGCSFAQGYLLSPPLSREELPAVLAPGLEPQGDPVRRLRGRLAHIA